MRHNTKRQNETIFLIVDNFITFHNRSLKRSLAYAGVRAMLLSIYHVYIGAYIYIHDSHTRKHWEIKFFLSLVSTVVKIVKEKK